MALKILVAWNSPDRIEQRDVTSLSKSLEDAGNTVTLIRRSHMLKKYDELYIDSYDLILMKPWFNAMFGSGGNMVGLKERLKNFKGKIGVIYCDIKMKFSPFILDRHEDGSYDKINFFDGLNACLVYSLHDSIKDDQDSLDKIKERTSDFNLPIKFIEWNFCTVSVFDELYSSVDHDQEMVYDKVYFGQYKKGVYESLKTMDFGKRNDIVIGGIAHKFPEAHQVYEKDNKGNQSGKAIPFEEYVPMSKYVLIPYEPIKSLYQVTLRFIESIALMNNKAELVFDPRVSDYLKSFTTRESLERKSKEVVKQLEDLVNE